MGGPGPELSGHRFQRKGKRFVSVRLPILQQEFQDHRKACSGLYQHPSYGGCEIDAVCGSEASKEFRTVILGQRREFNLGNCQPRASLTKAGGLAPRCQFSGSCYQDQHDALPDDASCKQMQYSKARIICEMEVVNNEYDW